MSINEKIMNITFRCDSSIEIGIGHVMRCLTLAHALKEYGIQCSFICREHKGNIINHIKGKLVENKITSATTKEEKIIMNEMSNEEII